jgi:hypothetical protein
MRYLGAAAAGIALGLETPAFSDAYRGSAMLDRTTIAFILVTLMALATIATLFLFNWHSYADCRHRHDPVYCLTQQLRL